jgi:hypothetical protein
MIEVGIHKTKELLYQYASTYLGVKILNLSKTVFLINSASMDVSNHLISEIDLQNKAITQSDKRDI